MIVSESSADHDLRAVIHRFNALRKLGHKAFSGGVQPPDKRQTDKSAVGVTAEGEIDIPVQQLFFEKLRIMRQADAEIIRRFQTVQKLFGIICLDVKLIDIIRNGDQLNRRIADGHVFRFVADQIDIMTDQLFLKCIVNKELLIELVVAVTGVDGSGFTELVRQIKKQAQIP